MVNINSLERDGLRQAELCPRHTMKMKTKKQLVVISNDKTIVRNLQRYFMIKMIHTDRALGPLNTVNPGYLEH